MERYTETAREILEQYPRISGILLGLAWAPILHAILR